MRFTLSLTPDQLSLMLKRRMSTGQINFNAGAGQTGGISILNNGPHDRLVLIVKQRNDTKTITVYTHISDQKLPFQPTTTGVWFYYNQFFAREAITNSTDGIVAASMSSSIVGEQWNGFLNGTCMVWPSDHYFHFQAPSDALAIAYSVEIIFIELPQLVP